jgi:hypothetical protein
MLFAGPDYIQRIHEMVLGITAVRCDVRTFEKPWSRQYNIRGNDGHRYVRTPE